MKYRLYSRCTADTDRPSGEQVGSFDSPEEAKNHTHRRRWGLRTGANGRRVWLGYPTADADWYDQIRQVPGD